MTTEHGAPVNEAEAVRLAAQEIAAPLYRAVARGLREKGPVIGTIGLILQATQRGSPIRQILEGTCKRHRVPLDKAGGPTHSKAGATIARAVWRG